MALRFANGLFEPIWNRAADRSRSDHRRGNRRRRAPRQVLREDRRAARHGAQPCVPAAGDDGDGAADLLRRRCGAGEEGRGHPGHTAADDPAQALRDAVRGQYDAGTVLGEPVRAYRREPDVAPDSATETFIAWQVEHRQLALGRRAVLSAHRQVHETPIDRDRDPLPSGALSRCSAARASSG